MQHHGTALAQSLHGVFPDVMSAYGHNALRGLIQPGNQTHQGALGAAGAAQDANGHAAVDMQADILQVPGVAVLVVFEIDMIKVHVAVFHGQGRVGGGVGDLGLLLQHLHNALAAGDGPGQHHHHHGHHHQGHEDFGGVGEEGDQVAGEHGAAHHIVAAQPHDGHDGAAHNEGHQGDKQHHEAVGPLRRIPEGVAALGKLLLLPVLPDEGFHHADGVQILLDHQVQIVGGLLQGGEKRPHIADDDGHQDQQQRQHHQEYLAQLQADGQGHDQGGDQHHRGPDQHAHAHHQGHLHRRNVVGEPGDQGCGGKMLNVGKGEPLHLGIFRGADVGAEAHTGPGGQSRRPHAHHQGRQGHEDHFQAHGQNVLLVAVGNAHVHDLAHGLGQQQLQHGLAG